MTTMLKAGVPLNKIDLFRDLLEEHGYALTSSTDLRQVIPLIYQEELSRIKREIRQRPLSIIFDGTTHVCEAFVIVLCYLLDDWELKQCVGRLKLLAKSMMGEEVAQQIIVVLSTELGIPPLPILATMRDRASINDVAMRTIKVVYNQLLDVGCFSHTLDHVGERMNTPNFMTSAKPGLVSSHEARNPACCGALKLDYLHLRNLPLDGGISLRSFVRCSQPSVTLRSS